MTEWSSRVRTLYLFVGAPKTGRAGVASWYDFSVAIQEEGIRIGLLDSAIPVLPVPTQAYPTPAKRPAFSVLDKTTARQALNINPLHWRTQLCHMLSELSQLQ